MPSNGENPLARLAHAIANERGFRFGTPRVSDDGSAVVVPILRPETPSRRYLTAAESTEAVSAFDIGRIDRLRVRNDGTAAVFLPPGTLFEGRDTPSRGTIAGTVLHPAAAAEVPVKCVHAAQPVREGAPLNLATTLAPALVAQALLAQDQGLVWATVATVVPADLGDTGHPSRSSTGSGDLLDAVGDGAHDGVVSDGNECGAVLLHRDGVAVVEVFDHPDSWKFSLRPQVAVHAEGRPRGLSLDSGRAVQLAKEFFAQLAVGRYHPEGPQSWVANDGRAGFTTLDGEVIHLIAFGRPLIPAEGGSSMEVSAGTVHAIVSDREATGPVLRATPVPESSDADVASASLMEAELLDAADVSFPMVRSQRRKVLTSGWDAGTFGSLERYAAKEFRGDRSAAIRFLVRNGLRHRGYLGPSSQGDVSVSQPWPQPREPSPALELSRTAFEARIHDFERIVQTGSYATWLRQRARSELERVASSPGDESLRAAAQSALDRLPSEVAAEELPESIEEEAEPAAAPPLPPVDVRPLLRRAFAASAGGRYPEALILFGEVLLAEPDNRTALLGRAVALRRSGKTQEALDGLDTVLQKEPANAAALLNRGRILQERGDLEGALASLDALARVAPNDWDVWMVRGDVLGRMGRERDAREAYAEALQRNPDDEELLAKIRALDKIQPPPAPTPLQRTPLPREVQEGQSYLVKERRPDLSLRVLRALLLRSVPAMLITTRSSETVRRESGLAGIRTVELSHAPGEGHQDPTALAALTHVVEHFLRENHLHGVVVLEGLTSLILENGFRETALFIEHVHETILQSHALFLVSVTPGDLEERELALLERSLVVLS